MQCVDLGGRRIIKKKFFQAEDGIRDVERSRGLGDVYKRQVLCYKLSTVDSIPYIQSNIYSVSYTHLTLPTICSV